MDRLCTGCGKKLKIRYGEFNSKFLKRKSCDRDCANKSISISVKKLWEDNEYSNNQAVSHTGKIGNKASNWQGGKTEKRKKNTPRHIWNKRISNALTGKKRTEEQKEHQRKKMLGRFSGKNNPMYVKDRSKIKKSEKKHLCSKYKEWSTEIKKRDNWKCKINNNDCSGRLESHHILRWRDHPELRYIINNGVTLCRFHHPQKKNDEMKLASFFKKLIAAKGENIWFQ